VIDAQTVKQLREKTGAGMMDCKRALEETGGDMEKAVRLLREKGLAAAARKAGRASGQGVVDAYVHPGGRIGVLIEVNCETDFVARTEDFAALVHDLAMQVAASAPQYVRREDVPEDVSQQEADILARQAEGEGKPPQVVEKIVAGRLNKFFGEICLLEQPFIRDPDMTVEDLIKETIARLGENIQVARFVRYELNEGDKGE